MPQHHPAIGELRNEAQLLLLFPLYRQPVVLSSGGTFARPSAVLAESTVTELSVDPLADFWYVLLGELQRFSQCKASGILQRSRCNVRSIRDTRTIPNLKKIKLNNECFCTSRTKTPQSFSLVCCGIFCGRQKNITKLIGSTVTQVIAYFGSGIQHQSRLTTTVKHTPTNSNTYFVFYFSNCR